MYPCGVVDMDLQLINKEGKETLIKWHWRPTCGLQFLLEEEAAKVVAQNHSHATKDLYDTIASGSFPEWRLYIQTMDPNDEDKYDFDPMDTTKIWPEELFPLQPVGRMVLNKNLDNFFNENEQLAFSPGVVPPGIYYSNDKMLQCRIFAYGDTQRHRLKCAHHNNHHEGRMNFLHRDEEVSVQLK
jgi:catalase